MPVHFLKPLTVMSHRLCLGELKGSATGKPQVLFWILQRCSPNRLRREWPVSPMYSWGIYSTRCSTQCSLICRESVHAWWLNSGPRTWTLDVVYRQVRQWGCRHVKVPDTSVWDLSEVCTRISPKTMIFTLKAVCFRWSAVHSVKSVPWVRFP